MDLMLTINLQILIIVLCKYIIHWNPLSSLSGLIYVVIRSVFTDSLITTVAVAWISNDMPNEVWNEITYPFVNFNGATIEV